MPVTWSNAPRWVRITMLTGLYGTIAVVAALVAARATQSHFGTPTAERAAAVTVYPAPTTPDGGTPTATSAPTRTGRARPATTRTSPSRSSLVRSSSSRSSLAGSSPDRSAPARAKPGTKIPRAAAAVNLAAGRSVQASSHVETYVATQVTDGDQGSYWESAAAFPQRLRVDLGSVTTVGRLQLKLPAVSDWNRRVQTLSVYGSRDGRTFTRLRGPAPYVFDANSGSANTASIALAASGQRYVELRFSANDGWKAAQLSELQVHSS